LKELIIYVQREYRLWNELARKNPAFDPLGINIKKMGRVNVILVYLEEGFYWTLVSFCSFSP
jgi:hypothetical protein